MKSSFSIAVLLTSLGVAGGLALSGCVGPRPEEAGFYAKKGSGGSTAASTSGGAGGSIANPPTTPLLASGIALGASHTCALLDTGEVACWGDGSKGQLGDGVVQPGYYRSTAEKIAGLTGVRALRAGGDTTCAVLAASVVCWGDGTYGQLGDGTAQAGYARATPARVTGLGAVLDLGLGGDSACAVASDGTVLCWGRNTPSGWLGFSSTDCGPYPAMANSVEVPCESAPRVVPGVVYATAIATSGDHSCAVLKGGALTCWGADNFGQLGDGFSGSAPHDPAPVAVSGLSVVHQVALGVSHTCALAGEMGATWCWGDNSDGQLGIGSAALDSNRPVPTMVPNLDHVVDVAAAGSVTCAVLADGSASCWGDPSSLFPAGTSTAATPAAALGITHAVFVRTGGEHACALRSDHTVVCWGRDDAGQLGNGQLSLGDFVPAPVIAPQ